jgi:VanZ family protein
MNPTGRQTSERERAIDVALWFTAALCALITLWFSFGASPPGADAFAGADKVGHMLAYFATMLSFLFAAVWRPVRGGGSLPNAGYWFPVVAVLAGIVIEIFQGFTSTRSAQAGDVLAEVIGAGLALGVHAVVRRRHGAPGT